MVIDAQSAVLRFTSVYCLFGFLPNPISEPGTRQRWETASGHTPENGVGPTELAVVVLSN